MGQPGRPKKETLGVMVRLPVEMIDVIDDVRREEKDVPTRPEMIRRMILDWIERSEQEKGQAEQP